MLNVLIYFSATIFIIHAQCSHLYLSHNIFGKWTENVGPRSPPPEAPSPKWPKSQSDQSLKVTKVSK
eukprot:473557-Prorocentrum_minimum.AAC.1